MSWFSIHLIIENKAPDLKLVSAFGTGVRLLGDAHYYPQKYLYYI